MALTLKTVFKSSFGFTVTLRRQCRGFPCTLGSHTAQPPSVSISQQDGAYEMEGEAVVTGHLLAPDVVCPVGLDERVSTCPSL